MTKAAASAARAQPAQRCDRKYDKHLSYSAARGRSAGRAGSRRVGAGAGGKNPTPRRGVRAATGLSRRESREGASGRGRRWGHSAPDDPAGELSSDPQRYPNGWMGAPAGAGGRKCPLCVVASARLSKWVTKSTALFEQDGRTELHPRCQAAPRRRPGRRPSTGPESVREGREARRADGPLLRSFKCFAFPCPQDSYCYELFIFSRDIHYTGWKRCVCLNGANLKSPGKERQLPWKGKMVLFF